MIFITTLISGLLGSNFGTALRQCAGAAHHATQGRPGPEQANS